MGGLTLHLRGHLPGAGGWASPVSGPLCVPDLGQDLDQLKEIMKVTGTPPAEFVQRLQSDEVSRELGGGWGQARDWLLTACSCAGQELHEGPP